MGSTPPTSRQAVLLAALGDEPVSTSELYDRLGYRALARIGLIPYPAFRAALADLAARNLVAGEIDEEDGSTVWRRAPNI